jgi:hypothetical protein
MEWGKPEILWGLIALIIPVLIHLLHLRRYKEVAFSNVAFLADVHKETKSRHRLKNLLVLLMRLIAFGAIVCAFADPFIPLNTDGSANHYPTNTVGIYIDNSPSMLAHGEDGELLQIAKSRATEIINEYSETDKFNVITNDFKGEFSRNLTQEESLEKIASIKPMPFSRDINTIVRRVGDNTIEALNSNRILYILSDLQKTTHKLSENFSPDTNVSIHFIPCLANDRPNIWIDSAWFSSPIATSHKPADLNLRIKHNALTEVEGLSMRLFVDGSRKAVGTFNLSPGLATDTVLRFSFGEAGFYNATIEIDDSPITFDDEYNLGFEVVEKIRILQLTDNVESATANDISRVFNSNIGSVVAETRTNLPEEAAIVNFDMIISNGLANPSSGLISSLRRFAEGGGTVLIIPDSSSFNSRTIKLIETFEFGTDYTWIHHEKLKSIISLNFSHPLFKGVFSYTPVKMDLPKSNQMISRRKNPKEENIGTMWGEESFLSRMNIQKGQAYLFGCPITKESGNITSHALFIPILLRMTETSRMSEVKAVTLGTDESLNISNDITSSTSIRVISTDSTSSIIPESRTVNGTTALMLGNGLQTTGSYHVVIDDKIAAAFGVNASRLESESSAWDVPTFREQLSKFNWSRADIIEVTQSNISSVIKNIETGYHIWWYLVCVVILALTGETILQKRWKTIS